MMVTSLVKMLWNLGRICIINYTQMTK